MLKLAALALLIGAVSTAVAPTAASPPLCFMEAHADYSVIPWLATITVRLKPGCPPSGLANVRLMSDASSTDPPNDWLALTPCIKPDESACTNTWRGVLLRPLNWHP